MIHIGYVKHQGPEVLKYPYSLADLRTDNPHVGFYDDPSDEALAEFGSASKVYSTDRPAHDPHLQRVVEVNPAPVDGIWRQAWAIVPATPDEIAAEQAMQQAAEVARIEALWQAAHAYEFAQISGSAIGLLTLGVLQSKPKCMAVQAWIKSIWTSYYERKASGSADVDFSGAGQIPHTIPEMMEELQASI